MLKMMKVSIPSLAVVAALVAAGCTSSAPAASPPGAEAAAASPAPAAPAWVDKIKAGALVLDVRTQGEWDGGHYESAKLVPVDQVAARLSEIEGWLGGDKTKPIVVYCQSGRRATAARETLLQAGFTNVDNAGGFRDVAAQLGAGAGG